MIKSNLLLFSLLLLVSCNSSKLTVSQSKKPTKKSSRTTSETIQSTSKTITTNEAVYQYIARYKETAMSNMRSFGIPASIILAQGILESGAGKGTLAVNANNHFGIKCHNDWTGESTYHDDDKAQECFRKYTNPAESYRDHALFLSGKKRYSELFLLPKDDYKSWAKGLKMAGYATDPQYSNKLVSYIERYELHQIDALVLGKKSNDSAVLANVSGLYEVQKGDTLYSIAKKFNILVEDLQRKNNLPDASIAIGQQLIVK